MSYQCLELCIFSTAAVDAWVLYISTDYVFDGTKPPYKTTDETNPLNKYGMSKLEGEKVTFQVSEGKIKLWPDLRKTPFSHSSS